MSEEDSNQENILSKPSAKKAVKKKVAKKKAAKKKAVKKKVAKKRTLKSAVKKDVQMEIDFEQSSANPPAVKESPTKNEDEFATHPGKYSPTEQKILKMLGPYSADLNVQLPGQDLASKAISGAVRAN